MVRKAHVKPGDLRCKVFHPTRSELRRAAVPIFLLPFCFAMRNANLEFQPQHTRTHSIPSNAPNFFSLLEMCPSPTVQ